MAAARRPRPPAPPPLTLPSTTRTGYAVGGGVGYALTEKLSAKVEAPYLHLGRGFNGATAYDSTANAYGGAGRSDAGFALVRAGLNDRFRPPTPPRTRNGSSGAGLGRAQEAVACGTDRNDNRLKTSGLAGDRSLSEFGRRLDLSTRILWREGRNYA